MMRPTPATWFEILSAKDDATWLVEALAGAGCAEFETATAGAPDDARADGMRQRYLDLDRRYRAAWPRIEAAPAAHAFPSTLLARALARIEAWAAAADPELDALAAACAELAGLEQWQRLLAAPELGPAERASLVGGAGRLLAAAIFAGERVSAVTPPPGLLVCRLAVAGESHLLAVGLATELKAFADRVALAGGRRIAPPPALADDDPAAALAAATQRCRDEIARCQARLVTLAAEHRLAEAVADAEQGDWCLDNVASVATRRSLCSVTGWTADAPALARTVDASGARALVRFGSPPPGLRAPLLLHNPWWVSPYERFSRLVGMPERDAADPSLVVAFAFPLLFGYMFGDLGQGLLLACAGVLLGRRWPLARLFIPGGVAAAVFGLLFGSVFSLHGVLPPLWVDPLAAPLPVLLVPLYGGAALLFIGLALAASAARWRGEFAAWLRSDGAAAAVYAGLAAGFIARSGVLVAVLVAGAAALFEARRARRFGAFAAALGGIAEKAVQLAINTLSFVRVGAFAIAHAGLSAALGMLAADAGAAAPLVIVVGNAFIIALEVLVVSIQTTRLLLFEFFIRFFVGTGRAFQPAPRPPSEPLEPHHEP